MLVRLPGRVVYPPLVAIANIGNVAGKSLMKHGGLSSRGKHLKAT